MDDVRSLDRPWTLQKVLLLLDGEVEVDGDLWTGLSAYEARVRAETSSSFPDLILDAIQMDQAIQRGIQRDHEVRIAMLLRTRGGYAENEIEAMLGSKRPGYALLQRGAELVRRQQRGSYNELRRVRANRGLSDTPVCWRCLKVEVPRPGDYCGCQDPEQKSKRSHTGPGATYDPADRPPVSEMTPEEIADELSKLAATQERGPIPGGEHYRKRVLPMGADFHDPEDIRQKDAFYRQHGYRMTDRGGRCE